MKQTISKLYEAYYKFITLFFNGLQWGYEKRYLYHLDGLENDGEITYILFHIRGKRTGCRLPISLINKDNLLEIHPIDAFFIGALSISTDQHIIKFMEQLYADFKNRKKPLSSVKADSLLVVSKVFFQSLDEEKTMIHLKNCGFSSAKEIKLHDLVSNPDLLIGLGSASAFKIGQEISRMLITHEENPKH